MPERAGLPRRLRVGSASGWARAWRRPGLPTRCGLGLVEVELGHRRHRPQQRTVEVGVDQLTGRIVEGGDGAAVRAGGEPEMREVVRPARLPAQLHRPATVLVAPGVPAWCRRGQAARHQRRGDGLQQRQHRRAVGEHGMGGRRQLGGAGALQQHRVGEPLNSRRCPPRRTSATCSTDAPARMRA